MKFIHLGRNSSVVDEANSGRKWKRFSFVQLQYERGLKKFIGRLYNDCFHRRAKVHNLNLNLKCTIWMIIRMTDFGPCVRKITSRRVILNAQFKWWSRRSKMPSFEWSFKCAIQITHRDVILRTHGPRYCHSNDHSNCSYQIEIQIAHFCSRVKTINVV